MARELFHGWLMVCAACLAGCRQPYVMTKADYIADNTVTAAAYDVYDEDFDMVSSAVPPTVREPGRRVDWELTLNEAIQIGLEHNKLIRVLEFLPGEAGTDVEAALASFDPVFEAGTAWRQLRQPPSSVLFNSPQMEFFGGPAGFGTNSTLGGPSQLGFTSIPGGNTVGLAKRNATGGLTGFSYSSSFANQVPGDPLAIYDPRWDSRIAFGIEQPLLQGAGVEFNRAPILIARAGHQQAAQNFDSSVRTLLRDIERAYWDLSFAYSNLYSREIGMELALALWQSEKARLEEGAGTKPAVAQAREQYESFRDARLQALSGVLNAESVLRELLGLPPQDDRRLVTADDPTRAEVLPDWESAVFEARQYRPELGAQRLAVRAAELELDRQRNGLLPDVSLAAEYAALGADDSPGDALSQATSENFEDWTVGVRLRVPLGERAAHAAVRRAELRLLRERATLNNAEQSVVYDLQRAYQALHAQYELYDVRQSRKRAAREFLQSQIEVFQLQQSTLIVVLEAQTRFIDAVRDEAFAVTRYNQALADWEFAKGTITNYDNVMIVEEDVLPRNREQLRARAAREQRAVPVRLPEGDCPVDDASPCADPRTNYEEPLYRPGHYESYGTVRASG